MRTSRTLGKSNPGLLEKPSSNYSKLKQNAFFCTTKYLESKKNEGQKKFMTTMNIKVRKSTLQKA